MTETYKKNLANFDFSNGISAILLFFIMLLSTYLQGFMLTTSLSTELLAILNQGWPLFDLVIVMILIFYFKDSLATVGLTKSNLLKSASYGILGSIILLVVFLLLNKLVISFSYIKIQIDSLPQLMVVFLLGSISEEIVFRGYIETRLTALFKNIHINSIITAVLFLLIHYPFYWAVSGFGLGYLAPLHITMILLLHFFCSTVYRMTNSLWGAILLHFIYNLATSILILK